MTMVKRWYVCLGFRLVLKSALALETTASSSDNAVLVPPVTQLQEEECQLLENGAQDCRRRVQDNSSTNTGSVMLPKCTLYMAPSTIPGAGLGIFTGVDRGVDEVVGNGDVMFPIVDVAYHLEALGDEITENFDIMTNPTLNYIWFGPEMGMSYESAHPFCNVEYVSAFAPGLDAAINCNLALPNVEKRLPIYDTAGLHRSKDPGAGGFTPYHKCETYTTYPIPAGGELFKYYGDGWFINRKELFGPIPLTRDYRNAEKFVQKFTGFAFRKELSDEVAAGLWTLIANLLLKSRFLNALPKNMEQFKTVHEHGIRAMYQPNSTRSIDFLQKHGRCLDYIKPAPSTVRQAGRGAFATQFLPKGTTVASSPMLFFPTDDFFRMYDGRWFKKDDIPNKRVLKHHQILYNYCYKHDDSSILLCPYGAGINYINHRRPPNVKLQWAADGEMGHQAKFLQQDPRAMMNQASPGLYMDVVAIQDIAEGEELFLDYGKDWELAWQKHVDSWPKYSKDYQSARDWNEANPTAMLRTEEEQEEEPYPSHFELRCIHEIEDEDEDQLSHEQAMEKWKQETYPGNPCRIIDRDFDDETQQYMYKVLYKDQDLNDLSYQMPETVDELEWLESPWLPRGALRFADRPYSTDLWLPSAFRHPIGFPDALFPNAWRGQFLSFLDGVIDD